MRHLKFKAWDGKKMHGPFDLDNNIEYLLDDKGHLLLKYTGLKDKNDMEIYEGDILSYKCDETLIIIIDPTGIATIVRPYTKTVPAFKYYIDHKKAIEIIGNIYENKELLEGDHCE